MKKVLRHVAGIAIVLMYMSAQNFASSAIDGPMRKTRQDMARLLDKLYEHRALNDRLKPGDRDWQINITVIIVFGQIFDLDEETQTLSSYISFVVTWDDLDLSWDPGQYGNIDDVLLDKERMWSPILNLNNPGDLDSIWVEADKGVRLFANGTARYTTPKFVKSSCRLDLNYYPLDTQQCLISFIPAVTITPEVQIISASMSEVQNSRSLTGEWDVSQKYVTMTSVDGYSVVDVHLMLKRKQLYYIVCILTPLAVTSFLVLFVFCLPPRSGERVSFVVSLFLTNAMTLNTVGETMPRGIEEMPIFVRTLLVAIIQSIVVLICTIFVETKHEEGQRASNNGRTCDASSDERVVIAPNRADDVIKHTVHTNFQPTRSTSPDTDILSASGSCDVDILSEVINSKSAGVWQRKESSGLSRSDRSDPIKTESCKCQSRRVRSGSPLSSIKAVTWDRIFFFLFFFLSAFLVILLIVF